MATKEELLSKFRANNYQSDLDLTTPSPSRTDQETMLQQGQGNALGGAANAFDAIFGFGKVGEAIGTAIARSGRADLVGGERLTQEEAQQVDRGPSIGEVAGSAIRGASLFTPIGRIGKAVTAGARALGIGRGAGVVGRVVGGGTAGAGLDVGASLEEGESPSLGIGTIIGAGIPASAPLAKALGRAAVKIGAETQGALTGTSAETIEQAFMASRRGGDELEKFTQALRGELTPEQLVTNVNESINKISTARQKLFRETLAELSESRVPTDISKRQFIQDLQNIGIKVGDGGLLDFSSSKLRTVPAAQSKLQQAWKEVSNLPETATIGEIDTTRQAIRGIKAIAGDDPSANLGNMLIEDATRSVRLAGEQVEGYGKMLDNFSDTSNFLTELQKGLSAGDQKTIDQTYRRIATSLKTNNEQRMILVQQLDAATDGAILSEISGQQLSEALPRGLFRQIAAGLAGTGIVTGGLSANLLPALVFASPKATGEFVRALGIGTRKTEVMIRAINDARDVLLKAGIVTASQLNREEEVPSE